MDDSWLEEECRSMVYNEKAQKLYENYYRYARDYGLAQKPLTNPSSAESEVFMRTLEKFINIPETEAVEFRGAVCVMYTKSRYPRYHDFKPMEDAIDAYMRLAQDIYEQYFRHATEEFRLGHHEVFMRKLESCIDISETQAVDFRRAVCKEFIKRHAAFGHNPYWNQDFAMTDAIEEYMKPDKVDKKPTKCTCDINVLMTQGCRCGHWERK